MRPECVRAVAQAAGRAITQAEAQAVEDKLRGAMRTLAMRDRETFQTLTPEQRLRAAAKEVATDLSRQGDLAQFRLLQQVKASARFEDYMRGQEKLGRAPVDSLIRFLVFKADGKSNVISVERWGDAIRDNALRQVTGLFEATDPRLFGYLDNPEGIRTVVRELFGEATGVKQAHDAAGAFLQVANELRQRFNAAGGNIPFRADWGLPHHHSQRKVANAGVDTWIRTVFPMLNRRRYFAEDGRLMNDAQVVEFLGEAYQSIATGGALNGEPGAGKAMLANAHDYTREIHFKDADGYLAYQQQFGDKGFLGIIHEHIAGLARIIAATERMGPNPDHLFAVWRDRAKAETALKDPKRTDWAAGQAETANDYFNWVTGRRSPIVNRRMAEGFDMVRDLMVASRLGSAVFASLPDEATLHLTAQVNHLPEATLIANELRTFNPLDRTEERLANRAGLALDVMVGEINRFGSGQLGPTWSSKLSNAIIRATGLNALDGARRRALGVTMYSALGQLTRDHARLASLDAADHRILLSKGLTDTDWAVWRKAELENWERGPGSDTMLTPDAIARIPDEALADLVHQASQGPQGNLLSTVTPQHLREQAITKLLAHVLEEVEMGVIRPGASEKVLMGGSLKRGTLKGELTRSFFLFKGFPLALIARHFMRGANIPSYGGKAAYLASLVVASTVLGAVGMQLNELASGKDPRNLLDPNGRGFYRNWLAAFLKGGSFGIYGDLLFSERTQSGGSALATVEGPILGLGEELLNVTQGNVIEALQGKDTKLGSELVHLAKGVTPGSNLWYTKAATDHLIFQAAAEYLNPGSARRMEQRAAKEFGQSFWWHPGDVKPERAPRLEAMQGR